jgi:2-dehydro-3-deoxygalactonokinase
LSNSIEVTYDPDTPGLENFFEEGVMQSLKSGVLENLFGLRVAHIFNKRSAQQNGYYLTGLLIGDELKNILEDQVQEIVLVSNELFKKYYSAALDLLKIHVRSRWVNSEDATVSGHQVIFERQFTLDQSLHAADG